MSQDSYVYPGEIVILKGFKEATTDEDNNVEGDEFKSKELIEVRKFVAWIFLLQKSASSN